MSPFASLTSIPWMFNSSKEGVLDKNPLTKFFDLLNNYLVLFVISFVILLPVLIAVLDIILLYKTVFKKRYSKRINYMFIFLQVFNYRKFILLPIFYSFGIILGIILVIVCFNKTRIILLNILNHLQKDFVIFFIHFSTFLWNIIEQRRIFII